jgi:hypothetical protein
MTEVFWISYAALWTLTALMAVAVFALLRLQGSVLIRTKAARHSQGPAVGAVVRSMELRDFQGRVQEVPYPGAGAELVVAMVSDCSVCRRVLPALSDLAERRAGEVQVTIVYPGNRDSLAALSPGLSRHIRVVHDPRRTLMRTHGIVHSPFALVLQDGLVKRSGLVDGEPAVAWLLGVLEADAATPELVGSVP